MNESGDPSTILNALASWMAMNDSTLVRYTDTCQGRDKNLIILHSYVYHILSNIGTAKKIITDHTGASN